MRSQKVMRRLRGTWYKRESLDGEEEGLLNVAEEGLNEDEDELVGEDDQYGDDTLAESVEMDGSTLSVSPVFCRTCEAMRAETDLPRSPFCSGPMFRCGSIRLSRLVDSSTESPDTSNQDVLARYSVLRELESRLVSVSPVPSCEASRLTTPRSTVLNVLAGRKIGVVRGNIAVDGIEPSSEYYRNAGFVEQFDLHGK